MLFTVPLEIDEIISLHVAAQILDQRKATQFVYVFIRKQIKAAKEKSPKEFDVMFKAEKERVMKRSQSRAKASKKRGLRKVPRPAAPQTDGKKQKAQGGSA